VGRVCDQPVHTSLAERERPEVVEQSEYEYRCEVDTERERVRELLRNALYWYKYRGTDETLDLTVEELMRQLYNKDVYITGSTAK